MDLPLTEKEIEFMEHYHTSTSMTENLIPLNENAPQTWSGDCDCIYLYPYQDMMQNFSYLVANDPELPPQENFNKKKGSGDCYSIGSRNTGKCEYVENECQLADGSIKKFGDLIETTQNVISFNDKSLKLEKDKACFKDNGIKPCYKIMLHSGKEIIVTENHPLYTNEGWTQLKNINEDMMIATPRSIDIKSEIIIDDNEAKIIGYLLGDGSCTTSSISIANIHKELIDEIYELGKYFDCKVRTNDDSHFFSKKTIPAIRRGVGIRNNIHNIVIKYNINKLSKQKTIHPDIFMWSNKSIALVLNRLFACDGHVNKRDNFFEITLASEKMIQQIQTLLLRFGIHSNYNYKKAKCGEKYFDAWRLYVDADVNKLLNVIGIKSKDQITLNYKEFETSDVLPKNLISQYRHELDKPCLLNDKRIRGFSRNKVSSLCNDWYHPNLFKLSNSDIYWEWIDKIEFVGDLPTVMVSVEKNHTYISNNIISHNSFILKIDVLLTWIHKVREGCLASFDQKHLSKVTDPISSYLESHPFAKIFHLRKGNTQSINRKHGGLRAISEHGCLIESANEKIEGNNPGTDFQGKHYETFWYEEASFMSKRGTDQRIDAGSSLGYIIRPSGIPDLRIGSPLTQILQDKKLKRWIWRLPQMVRPDWSDEMREKRIAEYNGESCFDTKTEVLTNNGWKNYLTISEDDMVLSMNPETKYADYYKIKEIHEYDYNGDLNYYDGLKLNFAITDNHKLLYQTTKKGLRLESLKNLTNHNNKQEKSIVTGIQEFCRNCGKKLDLKTKRQKHFCSHKCNHSFYKKTFDANLQKVYIPNFFKFKGKNKKFIEFKTDVCNAKNHKIKMEDWLQFLGWWLAEGSISNTKRYKKNGEIYYSNTINVSQTKKYNLKEISDVLIRMGFTGKYNHLSFAFHFNSKAIVEHLKKECYKGDLIRVKTVYNCYNKKIPNYVYDLSPRLLNIFLDAFNKGDGDAKRQKYYTTSIQLANGLQELIYKAGNSAIIKKLKSKTIFGVAYELNERKYKQKGSFCRFNKIQRKHYTGKIWCLEVEPHHNFFIRRNNRCHFTGNSAGYKLNVLAETIEGAEGFWDIARLKENSYKPSRRVKYFEINKENFPNFRQNIIVERPAGTEQVFICSDIGYSGSPSQLIIIFKIGEKYKYMYNISMFKLIHNEQAEVVKWLYDVLGRAFIATDATGDNGAIIDDLFKEGIPQEHLLKVFFNANIEVGFEVDENGKILKDTHGNPLMKKANTLDWSMSELEKIMYSGITEIPQDENFFEEFNSYYVRMTGTRKSYGTSTTDHKHQSIPKDEIVLCKINDKIRVSTIEQISSNYPYKKFEVPTFKKGKLSWENATVYKEKNKTNTIYDFHLTPGAYVKTTGGHSMLVWNDIEQKLVEKQAKDVKVGDLLLNINAPLLETIETKYKKLDYSIYNRSLKQFDTIKIDVNEKLAYLLGMYCAEGCRTSRKDASIIYIGDDKNLADKILKNTTDYFNQYSSSRGRVDIRKEGTRVSPTIVSKSDLYIVTYNGQGVCKLFDEHCGHLAKNKKVPDVIFESPKNIINAYLRGLYDGDANKFDCLTTISRLLANGVYTLNSLLGKYSSIHSITNKCNSIEYYIKQGTRDGYYRNIPLDAFEEKYSQTCGKTLNRDKLENADYKFCNKFLKNKGILDKIQDFNFLKVKDIKIYEYNDYVYDLCVPNTENFVAGVGNIIVHNSFQCFAICRFFNEFNLLKNKSKKKRCYGVIS